jgi:RimJ/RimL family protein N-acetyltransferase
METRQRLLKKAFPWLRNKPEPQHNGRVAIRGEKVVIREKRLEDVADDYAWRTDEELAHLDATRPITMSYDEFLRHSREELVYGGSYSKRLAIDTLDGLHIGNCMFYDIDAKRGQAELGIMIGDRSYWSKGYGSDSVEILLTHIFTTTPLTRIYLHTLDWNHRARRSFARSGFREVKSLRRGGLKFVLMEINRLEWGRKRDGRGNVASPWRDHNGDAFPTVAEE